MRALSERSTYFDAVALHDVPDAHGLVIRSRTDEVRARGPRHVRDAVAVPDEPEHVLAGDGIPEHYCLVCRRACQIAPTAGELHGSHRLFMPLEQELELVIWQPLALPALAVCHLRLPTVRAVALSQQHPCQRAPHRWGHMVCVCARLRVRVCARACARALTCPCSESARALPGTLSQRRTRALWLRNEAWLSQPDQPLLQYLRRPFPFFRSACPPSMRREKLYAFPPFLISFRVGFRGPPRPVGFIITAPAG